MPSSLQACTPISIRTYFQDNITEQKQFHMFFFYLFIGWFGITYIFGLSHRLHSNSHNQKVQMHMMDLMSSIIMEGDGVTQELLDTILINLIPAHKVGFSPFLYTV